MASTAYYIIAGDLNLVSGSGEPAYDILLDQTLTGYFLDPGVFNATFNTYDIQGTFNKRYDLILNSKSVVDVGGVEYVSSSYTVDGNNGGSAPPSGSDYVTASDHLPVYADYTFDFPNPVNPPYPGSIVFTQVGATNINGVIEFMTLYRMDLTTLKITDNGVDINGALLTGEGEFDLSTRNTIGNWNDVPAGTFVRLGTNLTNDNTANASDRLLEPFD